MLDSLRIEMRSIIKIKDCLTRNQRIIPDIRENDKTPSWDGEIIVFNSDSISKKDIEGRVAVQIKGAIKENLSQSIIKYSLELSDFRNYLISNGAIVFVVCMKGFDEFKIYYNSLLPFDLIKLIKDSGEQKTKTIELQEFPKDDSIEIINIFLNFIRNQKLQGGTIDRRVLSLEDIDKHKLEFDKFNFGYTGVGLNSIDDFINYSLTHPMYIYAQPKGFDIQVPVDKLTPERVLSDISAQVTVDDKVFYDSYKVLYGIGKQVIKIGKSFNFYINTGKFQYRLQGTLTERIKDVKFLIALFYNKKVKINGVILPERTNEESLEEIKKHETYLLELEEIKSTLDTLGVKEDLEIDKLSNRDFKHLYFLSRSILYNESVPVSVNNTSGIGILTIGNINLMLVCNEAEEGNYKLINYFGEHNFCCVFSDNGNDFIMSPYIQLKKDIFLRVSNINYPRILDSIISSQKSKILIDLANLLVLEMLKAYDEQKYKETGLLKSAQVIMEWISSQSEIDYDISTLNRLQIIKRERDFLPNELHEIAEIKRRTTDDCILIGASILLESFLEAKFYYGKISTERQKEFDTYPIVNLWVGK